MDERIKILGVGVDRITQKEALDRIGLFLSSERSHQLVTLNSEMVLAAGRDAEFRAIINGADLVTADGTGVLCAASFLRRKRGKFLSDLFQLGRASVCATLRPERVRDVLPERVSGVDLLASICASDFMAGKKIYLLGAKEGIAARAGSALLRAYPRIGIAGAEAGFFGETSALEEARIVERINASGAEVLIVALGAPKQEKWIHRNLEKMPRVRLAMGVGGSLDVLSGHLPRAPKLMRDRGLEWLWRLLREPHRIGRIHDATLRFMGRLLLSESEDGKK